MIDKNGKLFGKINLIDLLIILVVLLAGAFLALRATGVVGSNESAQAVPVRISFYGTEVPNYVVESLEVGSTVYDYNEDLVMGVTESFEAGEPLGYMVDDLGETHKVVLEGHSSLTLTALCDAVIGDYGVTIDGTIYGVGHTTVLFAGQSKMYVKICAIEPVE